MATKGISKKIADLIKTATPKQKAIIVVRDWVDKQTIREEPLLTDEEAEAIRDSLTPEEGKEYNKWIRAYDIYADLAPVIGLAIAQYREQAEEIVGYIQVLESYTQEENHLNTIFEELKEAKSEKALNAFGKALDNLSFGLKAELKRDEEGYIEIDTENLFRSIKEMIKRLGFAYSCLKAFIVALDEWTDKRKSKKLMPPSLANSIDAIKSDTAINVAPTYSRKFLKERQAKGIPTTIAEQKKAIFPCYEDIPIDEEFLNMWRDKIDDTERIFTRNGK